MRVLGSARLTMPPRHCDAEQVWSKRKLVRVRGLLLLRGQHWTWLWREG
ncbi:TPA: hypothetical protein N0F65_001148 [Lagenidium giganteum]|uniref:Uncharacterized protein n=1 Tax=Lagenidium giganteum TaxID=4803 RepID=A0AAV2YUV1_9STRA|nr:TPA: hypothetical protein N0F65_001148 [Lagenidium giganteum]